MGKYKNFLKSAYEGKEGLSMCSSWKEHIEKKFPEFKTEPEIKVGDWVIGKWHYFPRIPVKVQSIREDRFICFSILDGTEIRYLRKATDDEVKEHLVNEAIKKGFKKGVWFINSQGDKVQAQYDVVEKERSPFFYYTESRCKHRFNMSIRSSEGCIYHAEKGWSTIIEEPKKKMTIEEIEKELGHRVEIYGSLS